MTAIRGIFALPCVNLLILLPDPAHTVRRRIPVLPRAGTFPTVRGCICAIPRAGAFWRALATGGDLTLPRAGPFSISPYRARARSGDTVRGRISALPCARPFSGARWAAFWRAFTFAIFTLSGDW